MTEFAAEVQPESPHVVRVSGEVDIATVDQFLSQARRALESAGTEMEIDCGGVTFIDSTGLGALVRLREAAVAAGKSVRLTHVPGSVSRVLELTGLAAIFDGRPEGQGDG